MKLSIDQDVITAFPDLRVSVVVGRSLHPFPDSERRLDAMRQLAISELHAKLAQKSLKEQPMILLWRDIYKKVGLNLEYTKPTVEWLVERVLSGEPFPRYNALVETYFCVQLRHLLPIGGYDLARIEPPIVLRYSPGGETFTPLGPRRSQQTSPGELIYSDSKRVLTRHCNIKDCDHSKLTPATEDVVLMAEALVVDIGLETLMSLTEDLVSSINQVFSGTVTAKILDVRSSFAVDF